MDIELHAGDVGEIWLNEGDVVCAIEASRFTLAGNEVETIDFLRRVADLFNCTVEYRDPGPSDVGRLKDAFQNPHLAMRLQAVRDSGDFPTFADYAQAAGLIGADGQPIQ